MCQTKAPHWTQDVLVFIHSQSHAPAQFSVRPLCWENRVFYWLLTKETSLLHHLRTGRKRRGRCSHTVDIYIQRFVPLKLRWSTLLPKSCYCEGHACLGLVYDTVYSFIRYSEQVYNVTISTFLCLSHFLSILTKRENSDVAKFSQAVYSFEWVVVFQGSSKLWPLEAKFGKA